MPTIGGKPCLVFHLPQVPPSMSAGHAGMTITLKLNFGIEPSEDSSLDGLKPPQISPHSGQGGGSGRGHHRLTAGQVTCTRLSACVPGHLLQP